MITNIRFRAEGDKVILQVEYQEPRRYEPYNFDSVWRDAKVEDILDVSKFCRTDIVSDIERINQRINDMNYSLNGFLMATQKTETTHE